MADEGDELDLVDDLLDAAEVTVFDPFDGGPLVVVKFSDVDMAISTASEELFWGEEVGGLLDFFVGVNGNGDACGFR